MSIASEITRLQNAKSALKTAIEGKGVSVPASTKLDGYSALVDSIEQGGGTSTSPNDVEFIDYDGTIIASYSAAEFANLASMPDNPNHTADGLVSQGWNWTLSNAKTYVADNGKLVIGQMYNTDNGATRITFDMSNWVKPWPITMQFTQSKANGVAVDWGDGSSVERVSGTTNVKMNHIYATTGVYVISLLPDSGCTLTLSGSSSYGSYLFAQNQYDRFKTASVKSVHLGNNLVINNYAFYYSYSLQSVTIPSGVTSIGSYAFAYNLFRSVTIPSSITSIGNNAFANSHTLQSVTIPSSVTSIGNSAFATCNSLKSVTIPSSVRSINDSVFSNCRSFQSVTIPSSVTSIGSNAFNNCYALKSVTIPSSVTRIGNSVFNYCYTLKSVTIPSSVRSMGTGVFTNCNSLQSVTIPSGITTISTSAFTYSHSLQSVTIPSNVTSIGRQAFFYCYSLQEMIFEQTSPPTLDSATESLGVASLTFPIYVPDSAVEAYKSAYTNYARRIKGISERE